MDGVCCDMERMKGGIDLECCRRCWRKMNSVRAALAQGNNEMMVILITTAGHEWSCNFSTDVKFNSDEYFNLFSITRDFICMKGDKNKRTCFEKLLDYMSRHCDLDGTIGFMLRRCPYAAEIMMGSWNMSDRT